jgi:hypothetical protein
VAKQATNGSQDGSALHWETTALEQLVWTQLKHVESPGDDVMAQNVAAQADWQVDAWHAQSCPSVARMLAAVGWALTQHSSHVEALPVVEQSELATQLPLLQVSPLQQGATTLHAEP